MDMDFIARYAPLYVEAGKLTVRIAFFGIIFALVVGAVCSCIQYYKIPVLKRIVAIYVALSHNTPLLVQLFFLYFGLPKVGIVLSSEACAVIGLTFLGGSYMSEAMRSGLEAVDGVQRESALSLGMNSRQVMTEIIFPQALSVSIPALCANVVFMIKETSVVSAIALADLMYVAKDLIGLYYQTDEALLMLVVSYLVILLPISIAATLVERRVRYAAWGDKYSV